MPTNNSRVGGPLRIALSVSGVSLLLLAAGCGAGSGTVVGKVLYQDKPVPGGTVMFIHPKKGSLTSAIGEDGSYQFVNVPAAEVKIAVLAPAQPKPNAPTQIPPGVNWEHIKKTNPGVSDEALLQKMGIRSSSSKPAMSVPLPKKYEDPLQSGLTYTVTSGEQTHDIKLE